MVSNVLEVWEVGKLRIGEIWKKGEVWEVREIWEFRKNVKFWNLENTGFRDVAKWGSSGREGSSERWKGGTLEVKKDGCWNGWQVGISENCEGRKVRMLGRWTDGRFGS